MLRLNAEGKSGGEISVAYVDGSDRLTVAYRPSEKASEKASEK